MQVSEQQQRTIDDLCRRYRIRTLRLFGSAAVGGETPASDVDLLVDFTPGQAPGAGA